MLANPKNYILKIPFRRDFFLLHHLCQYQMKPKKAAIIILILCVSLSKFSLSQTDTSIIHTDSIIEENIYLFKDVEVKPTFMGGDKAMLNYIWHEVNYPDQAVEENVEGTVYVHFIIEKNGVLTNICVPESINKYLDAEAIRVVKKMLAWNPGKQNGEFVRVKHRIPIKFVLT